MFYLVFALSSSRIYTRQKSELGLQMETVETDFPTSKIYAVTIKGNLA